MSPKGSMQLYKDGKPFGSPIEFAEDGNVNFNLSDTLNDKDAHTYFAVFQPAGTPASAPPWRVRLAGNEADLTDLASSLQGGDIRVVQDGKWYCLESEVLNQLTDPIRVYLRALTLVQLLSGIAKIRKASATPVKPAAVKSRHTDGNWYEAFSAASISTAAVGGTILFTGASEFEKALNVALRDDIVGHSVSDFLQKWDFAQLRRIWESIKLDLGGNDAKKGVQEVVRRGWASETDLAKFHQTVNFGDDTAPGAHSRLRKPSSVTSPNSLNEAAEFLRKLLEKWILSKA